jgi:hypothetical protein
MKSSVTKTQFFSGLLALACVMASFGLLSAEDEGFTTLFDGKSLKGWKGNTDGYVAADGVIACKGGGSGNLYTEKEYSDFEFRFEFKLTPGANNGIGIRAPMEGDPAFAGIEVQILDDGDPKYKDLQPYQVHGSVYGVIAAKRGALKPVGEWNQETIIAKGNHFKVILNGETIVDGVAEKPIDGREHPGLARKSGYICFCGHGDKLEFRNLRVKELK